jgi:hypothetical protein
MESSCGRILFLRVPREVGRLKWFFVQEVEKLTSEKESRLRLNVNVARERTFNASEDPLTYEVSLTISRLRELHITISVSLLAFECWQKGRAAMQTARESSFIPYFQWLNPFTPNLGHD